MDRHLRWIQKHESIFPVPCVCRILLSVHTELRVITLLRTLRTPPSLYESLVSSDLPFVQDFSLPEDNTKFRLLLTIGCTGAFGIFVALMLYDHIKAMSSNHTYLETLADEHMGVVRTTNT